MAFRLRQCGTNWAKARSGILAQLFKREEVGMTDPEAVPPTLHMALGQRRNFEEVGMSSRP